jgi:hypothetical protein
VERRVYKKYMQHVCIHVQFWMVNKSVRLNIGVAGTCDRLCGLVVRVFGYRSGGPGSIPGTTRKKVAGLERGPPSLVSTTEELLDRKVEAPV